MILNAPLGPLPYYITATLLETSDSNSTNNSTDLAFEIYGVG
jgi:hypothetical protein